MTDLLNRQRALSLAVISVLSITTLVSGAESATAVDANASGKLEIRLSIEASPDSEGNPLIMQVEASGEGVAVPLIHSPFTAGGTRYDLAFDLIIEGDDGYVIELTEDRQIFSDWNTRAFVLASRRSYTYSNPRALVVVVGRKARIYLNDHVLTRIKREYSVKVKYHHFYEDPKERFPFADDHDKAQKWTDSNHEAVVVPGWEPSRF